MRILLVDDSHSILTMLELSLSKFDDIEIVGKADNAELALQLAKKLKPDVITLDVEMPGKTGLDIISDILKNCDAGILMCSYLTYTGAYSTIMALEKGAIDYIHKQEMHDSISRFKERIDVVYQSVLNKRRKFTNIEIKYSLNMLPYLNNIKLIVIGVSTGGPQALQKLFSHLPNLKVPIVIVQHMSAIFIVSFCERIKEISKRKTYVLENNQTLLANEIYFAPGDKHVIIKRQLDRIFIELSNFPKETCHKPSIDVLFQTAAEVCTNQLLALILTGMGKDGKEGAKTIKNRGGFIIAEKASSAVVYGMPKAVIDAHLANYSLDISDIPSALNRIINGK